MGLVRIKMILKRLVATVFALLALSTVAEEVAVPHAFSSGATIQSMQMNENFSAIATAINQQASQIVSIESSISEIQTSRESLEQSVDANGTTLMEINTTLMQIQGSLDTSNENLESISETLNQGSLVSDQLICTTTNVALLATNVFSCLQASSPTSTRNLTISQIFDEGWITVSAGGELTSIFVFHLFE